MGRSMRDIRNLDDIVLNDPGINVLIVCLNPEVIQQESLESLLDFVGKTNEGGVIVIG